MASWPELKQYITANYDIMEDIGRGVMLGFRLPGNRLQHVYITHYAIKDDTEDWALIESPVGSLGEVNLTAAIRVVGNKVVGGIAVSTDFDETLVTVRHAVPLANLDANEFESPLALVTLAADELEAQLTGQDVR